MPEANDPIVSTLDSLRDDVDRAPLAGASAARHRGDQRTRRQAIGGGLATLVLVAGVIGVAAEQSGGHRTSLPSVTRTPSPTVGLAAQPLFGPGDLGTVGPYSDWQVNPDPVPAGQLPSRCIPDPGTLGGSETRSRLLYLDGLDARAFEHVVRFADAERAASAVGRLSRAFASCDPGDPAQVSVKDRGPVEEGPLEGVSQFVRASRTGTPVRASEISYYELGVARTDNVVVVLQWASMGKPDTGNPWVFTGEMLITATQRAVD
jgi:hypothetical protein